MMIKNKQRELMSLLLRSKNVFITSHDLASSLALSDRTVRTYINDLKTIIEAHGGQIISKQGLGYQLQIKDRTTFNVFLIKHHFLDCYANQSRYREASDRKHYLLNLLLLTNQQIDIENTAETLFISLSQLNKDLAEIKKQLHSYELSLKKNKCLIYVDGAESAKRHFIMSYFFKQESSNFLQRLTSLHKLNETVNIDSLTIIILDACREAKLILSDVMIQNIVLHLWLSIKRLQLGLPIQKLELPKSRQHEIEYHVAETILERTQSIIGFIFPKEEQVYLTLHLMSKSSDSQKNANIELSVAVNQLIAKIEQETDYLFLQDEQLINGMIQHLTPMLIRLEQKVKLQNPLLDEIKQNYPELLALTKYYFSTLPQLAQFIVTDDEWGYLSLHLLAAIEKQKNAQKAKVLIICATGFGSAYLLKNRIENEFDDRIKIMAIKGYYEIESHILNDVDFIISSIDLSANVFKVPVFQVSVFLTEQDILPIRQYLLSRQNVMPACQIMSSSELVSQSLPLANIIDDLAADYFHYFKEADLAKDKILDQMLTQMAHDEDKDYKSEMVYKIANRVSLGDIFFSSTIVVPHPTTPVGKLTKIGIALVPNGFFWDENYPDVKFVFMISPSIFQNTHLAIITKAIVALTSDLAMQEMLLTSQTYLQFKSLFLKLFN